MKTPNNGKIVDFTREPIIETIITPKEGCKLVVRSSKNTGQEEYFVDAVEVVSFGHSSFFRSLERPKPFLVPVSDYELLEVREARMVLKSVGIDRSIKIGGGRETPSRSKANEKETGIEPFVPAKIEVPVPGAVEGAGDVKSEERPGLEKKRDRRRQYRKRRGGSGNEKADASETNLEQGENEESSPVVVEEDVGALQAGPVNFSSLLQPPPTLISETINRYRENALFKSAFFLDEEDQYQPHDKVQELLEDDENQEEYIHVNHDQGPENEVGEISTEEGQVEGELDVTSPSLEKNEHRDESEPEKSEVSEEVFEKVSAPLDVIELPQNYVYQPYENYAGEIVQPLQPTGEYFFEGADDFYREPHLEENHSVEKHEGDKPEMPASDVVEADENDHDDKNRDEEKKD